MISVYDTVAVSAAEVGRFDIVFKVRRAENIVKIAEFESFAYFLIVISEREKKGDFKTGLLKYVFEITYLIPALYDISDYNDGVKTVFVFESSIFFELRKSFFKLCKASFAFEVYVGYRSE